MAETAPSEAKSIGLSRRFIAGWDKTENWISALLLASALVLSMYGVIARYVLHLPLDWSDETAVWIIVWCAFFGFSALIKIDEHIRVDVLLLRLSEKRQNILHFYNTLIGLAFIVVTIWGGLSAVQEAHTKKVVSESAMRIPMYIPYLIVPGGGILLGLRLIERLIMFWGKLRGQKVWRDPILYGLIVLTILLWGMLTTHIDITLALVVMLVITLFLGMPVGFAMGIASLVVLLSFHMMNVDAISPKLFWGINKFTLIAIPYFIFAGNIMMKGGLARPLLELGYAILKRLHGGLAIAVMFAAVIFSAISGVSAALAATLGLIAIPWMMEKGYPRPFCMGLIGAGGTLDILIPPSTILIIYGAVSGESITDLYIAGFLPGVLLALAMCIQIYYICKRHGFGAPDPEDHFSWSEVGAKFKKSIWALLMPLLIMGGIYSGIFTVTEAAVVAVFYAVIICCTVYRNTGIKDLAMMLKDSVVLTSMIYFVIMTGSLFGFLVTVEQVSNKLIEFIITNNLQPWMFLAIINIVVFIMGGFLAPATIFMIVVPIVYPALGQLGISPIHFGILMTINMELAFLTPPIGMHLFIMSSICKAPLEEVIKGMFPFLILLLVGMFIITYIPWISLVFLSH
jgi:C4-dicarboxylate transporter DctM subunit